MYTVSNLFLNHIYARTPMYRRQFLRLPKSSRVWYPSIADRAGISVGEGTQVLAYSRLQCFPCDGRMPQITIGDHCYLGYHLSILAGADVTIEHEVLMASNVLITSESHGMDPESSIPYMDQPLTGKPVHIKSGCWIGEKACIMPGVTIGEKCIVGAGSIVTKSIPDYCMAVGNPAKVIKRYNFTTHAWERCGD